MKVKSNKPYYILGAAVIVLAGWSLVASANEPRIYYVRTVLPPFRAMTIPPFGIFINKSYKDNLELLKHEKTHWIQYQRMGLLWFYLKYFSELVFIGYNKMPMETEAKLSEQN